MRSEDWARWTCQRKLRYTKEARALAARRSMRKAGKPVAGLVPYQCTHCGGWHLGNVRRNSANTQRPQGSGG